jgi:hypothetical protein
LSSPKVLFVVGMARSGSTLLTALLNGVDGCAGLGEVHVYWELVGGGRRCGCGCDLDECPVWGELRQEQRRDGLDFDEMRDSFHAYVRPRPSSLLRGMRARRGGAGGARLARYAATMESTYRWLAARTGAELLVDSTKLPAAAELVAGAGGSQVYVVHLVRDPRAVAHSLGRRELRRGRPPALGRLLYAWAAWRAAFDWTLRNAYVEAKLRRLQGRYLRLRFEDLTADPQGSLALLLGFAGLPASRGTFEGPVSVRLGENHILTGDESRFKRGLVKISPNQEWRSAMPGYLRATTTLIAAPLLRLYSYPLALVAHDSSGRPATPG